MDKSSTGTFINEESYKNKNGSWKNKYHSPLEEYVPKWYYGAFCFKIFKKEFKFKGFIIPDYREKFMWSSTALVFLTDYWHEMQFYFLNILTVGIAFCTIYGFQQTFIYWFEYELNIFQSFTLSFVIVEIGYGLVFNRVFEKK